MAKIYLLSDDSSEIDKVLGGLELKYQVESFKQFNDFITELSRQRPDVVILDHQFKQINIIQLITKLKEKDIFKDIPVIVLTTPECRDEIVNCIKLGIKDFLIKPYLISVLVQKIKNLVSSEPVGASNTASGGSLNIVAEEKRKKLILAELENLPAFPLIVQKVIQIAGDRKSSAGDFENVVNKDQTLTAKMLRMANSSFYNLQREVVLIRDAVVTLGYNTVKSIAFAAGTGEIFKKNLPQYGLAPGGLWQHALGAAIAARTIGKEFNMSDDTCEELFVCGLLHDIGKLILGKFISRDDQVYLAPETGVNNICQLEKKLTGFDHSELGEKIADTWKLPEIIKSAIKYHHNPDEASSDSQYVSIVTFSNYICNDLKIGFSRKNTLEPKLMDSVRRNLDLNDDLMKSITEKVSENLKEIEKIAGI